MKRTLFLSNKISHPLGSSLCLFISLFAFMLPSVANAAASLLVTPSRIVFDDRTRTAQVTLMNQGDETGEYRINFIRQKMTENGQFEAVKADEEGMYSDTLVRYSPRQVSLPPGQAQVIRLMLRKPRNLPEGEYRSHMLFQTLPKPESSSLGKVTNSDGEGIRVEITPLVGISIPVIVRHGNLSSEVALHNARIVTTNAGSTFQLELDMHRSGNQSVYGDFRAIFIPNDGTEPKTLGLVNGIAVYTPNTLRRFSLPLRIPQGLEIENGKVRILYLENGKDEKTGLIAETFVSQ